MAQAAVSAPVPVAVQPAVGVISTTNNPTVKLQTNQSTVPAAMTAARAVPLSSSGTLTTSAAAPAQPQVAPAAEDLSNGTKVASVASSANTDKLNARAARFGTTAPPHSEPIVASVSTQDAIPVATNSALSEKLKSRAERFNIPVKVESIVAPPIDKKKKGQAPKSVSAPVVKAAPAEIDPVLAEKLKKRADRFGIPVKDQPAVVSSSQNEVR